MLSAYGMPRAGIVPVDEEANRSAWVPYVRVDDVEATLERVVQGGDLQSFPPTKICTTVMLRCSLTPSGGVTGIVKYEYAEDSTS